MRTVMDRNNLKRAIFFTILGIIIGSALGCQNTDYSTLIEHHKKLAGELRDNKLYQAAIQEYEKILEISTIDAKQRGNINYLIGRIYFEDLKDYENAAAYYLRARALDPEGTYVDEASRNLVVALEKMGNVFDAQREMAAVTEVDTTPQVKGDVPLAKIAGQPVWRSEVERSLQNLPPEAQKQFLSPEAKREFVKQYVGMELMYQAALREGFDRDKDIQRKKEMMLKQLLVEKYIVENVMPEVKIDTGDVRNFYLAHKSDRYEGAPYDSVRAQVFMDYQTEKAGVAFNEYISKLADANNVEFMFQNLK